jgi:hypothetical protein
MATDKKISQLNSGAPAEASDEYVVARSGANYKLTLTEIAGAMPAITTTGTVTVTGTGLKFNADFSNATASSRFTFQSSTTNGVTRVPAIPNGTSDTATWLIFNSSAANNCANAQFGINTTSAFFSTAAVGTGTAVPFDINVAGSARMRVTTTGEVGVGDGFGTTAPNTTLQARKNSGEVTVSAISAIDGSTATPKSSNFSFRGGSAESETARISSFNRYTNVDGGDLVFYTRNTSGTVTERMSIDSSGVVRDSSGKLRAIPQSGSAKTTSYSLATTDVGLFIEVGSGGSITIPDATFAAGDVVSIFNNTSGNITITCTITTAYIAGTDADKASVTLATRGVATILFISGTVCVISGNVS